MTRYMLAFGLLTVVACDDKTDTTDETTDEMTDDMTDMTDTTDETDTTDTGEPATARVRVLHLGQGVPGVDVFANDAAEAAVTNLMFKEGTDYLELPVGTYDFDVALNPGSAASPALTLGATLEADTDYVAFAYGFLDAGETGDALAITAVTEDNDVPDGTTRLNITHAAGGVGPVDVWLLGGTPTPLATNVAFGATAPDIEYAAGAISVGLDVYALSGGTPDGTADVIFSVPDLGTGFYGVYAVNSAAATEALDVSLVAHVGADGTIVELSPDE